MYQPIWCLLTFHHLHWTANSNTVEKSIMTIFFSLLNKWLLCPPSTPPSIWGCWMMGYIHKYTKGLYWLLNKQAPTYHSNYFQTIEYDRLSCNQIIMGRRTTVLPHQRMSYYTLYIPTSFEEVNYPTFELPSVRHIFANPPECHTLTSYQMRCCPKIMIKKLKKISTVPVVALCAHCKESEKNLAKKCAL